MDMSEMDMGSMSTGVGIPTFFQFQKYYWAVVGTVIAIATVANVLNRLLAQQRLHDKSDTPSKPKSIFFQTYATITATTRELGNAALQPINLKGHTLRLAPLGPVSLMLANLVTIIVMMFYGFDTENWLNWEDIGYRAGFMSICQLPLVILLAGKQNIIGLLTGTSYDYLNWYHRWVSRTLWLSATIHMGFWFRDYGKYDYIVTMIKTDYFTQHGFAAWCVLTFIFLTSFAPVRRWNYEFFVIQHIVTMAGFLAAVYLHAPGEVRFWVWIPIGFVCFDRFVRILVLAFANLSIVHFWSNQQRPLFANKATFTPLPGNVTRITIPNPLINWNPGQHVFLGCHSIAPLQSHPFTIMSIPSDNKLEFLVRAEKGGTRRFFRSATKHNALLGETQSTEKVKRTVFIEGPYGAVRSLRQFDSVVLLAGGMGCTYTLPLMRDIVHAWKLESQSAGTLGSKISSMAPERLATTKRIRFVWVIKSRSQLSWLETELQSVLQDLQNFRQQYRETDKEIEISIYLTCDESLERPMVVQHPFTMATHEDNSRDIEKGGSPDEKVVQAENVVVRSGSPSSGSTDAIQDTGCGVKKTCCCSTVIEDEDDISSMPQCTCSGPAASNTVAGAEKQKETALSSSSTSSLTDLKGFKTLAGRPHPRSIIGNVLERAQGESAVVHKTLDIITLFHKPTVQSSTRVLNLLRTASAHASEVANATLDQASDVSSTSSSTASSSKKQIPLRDDFEIEVTESLPTPDQLSTIIDYLGSKGVRASAVVEGAASKEDALKKLSESGFVRPIVVDWNNGRAVVGENQSEILRLLRKEDDSI
ncbi:hypothetical protein UA08_02883 [Talaromyces atroroseus]|uniref:ferric-chelate reductase (NADPH) n=1 Tax=Talaromyces atroroseus TaxID=1441469 RepID=A0A225AKZ9_TALAT|nr:hypothetical protein UA08_02883 [Talaromyces atroroseus]OKL62212.1 hypothetical protein UA08_02883 [Talaromyces atroroseus]